MKQGFMVVYEFANGSYSGYVPDLQGCIAAGETYEKIRKSMREVVERHVGSLVAEGHKIPIAVAHILQCPKPVQESDVQHWIVERMEIEVPVSGANECELKSAIEGAG